MKAVATVAMLAARAALGSDDMMMSTTMSPVCSMNGETVERNDAARSYLIGWYGASHNPFMGDATAMLWPYAMNKCTAQGPVAGGNIAKFGCTDEGMLVYTTYGNAEQCASDTGGSELIFNMTTDLLMAGVMWSCEDDWDTEDAYTVIQFDATAECETGEDTYGAIGVCIPTMIPGGGFGLGLEGTAQLYCDSESATLNFFQGMYGWCMYDTDFCFGREITTECDTLFTVYVSEDDEEGTDVTAKFINCKGSADGDDGDGDDGNDGESSASSVTLLLSAALVAVHALVY